MKMVIPCLYCCEGLGFKKQGRLIEDDAVLEDSTRMGLCSSIFMKNAVREKLNPLKREFWNENNEFWRQSFEIHSSRFVGIHIVNIIGVQ